MTNELYEADFFAWLGQQADCLLKQEIGRLDLPNLAEEIRCLGLRETRELRDRLRRLLGELLRWSVQPDERCNRWLNAINRERSELKVHLEFSPSLRERQADLLREIYPEVRSEVMEVTGLLNDPFPELCPFSVETLSKRAYPARFKGHRLDLPEDMPPDHGAIAQAPSTGNVPSTHMTINEFEVWPEPNHMRWCLFESVPEEMALRPTISCVIAVRATSLVANHMEERRSDGAVLASAGLAFTHLDEHYVLLPDLAVKLGPDCSDGLLTTPIAVVMILPPSETNQIWRHAWAITHVASLLEIVVIQSDRVQGHVLRRGQDGNWPSTMELINEAFELETIGLFVPLTDLYHGTHLASSVGEILTQPGAASINTAMQAISPWEYLAAGSKVAVKITPEIAVLLAQQTGNSPQFWISMQEAYDMSNDSKSEDKL